jgi:NifU-like protein
VSDTAKETSPKTQRADGKDDLFAQVRKLIDTDIRPYVQADGGDIELVEIEGQKVKVRLHGACNTCPSSPSTLREGVETRLKAKISPELMVEEVA